MPRRGKKQEDRRSRKSLKDWLRRDALKKKKRRMKRKL
jgi:hypothetical protein